jgi:RNA polymerase sigma-70 factor (ECF subfamily)
VAGLLIPGSYFGFGGVPLVIDVQKVDAARQGDKDSFAQVYECVAPDLYRVALYTLGNAHDAEDVVSETFIEAFKGIAKLRDPASFKAWIMKILSTRCKHKISDYIKGKNQFDIESFVVTLADDSDVSSDVSEQITVMQAMARLSEQERLIIALSVIKGYTTKEVSDMLGSPQGTISSKLHRALAKMRKILETQENIPAL